MRCGPGEKRRTVAENSEEDDPDNLFCIVMPTSVHNLPNPWHARVGSACLGKHLVEGGDRVLKFGERQFFVSFVHRIEHLHCVHIQRP